MFLFLVGLEQQQQIQTHIGATQIMHRSESVCVQGTGEQWGLWLIEEACPTLRSSNFQTFLKTQHSLTRYLQTIQLQGFRLKTLSIRDECVSYLKFSSVAQLCPTLCDPMNCSTPGLPVHHHLPEFTQTHVHRVGDAIQPSHPLSSPSPPAPNPSQHQSLFQ